MTRLSAAFCFPAICICLCFAGCAETHHATEQQAAAKKSHPMLACRMVAYGPFIEQAWTHLPSVGVQGVEIVVPAPDQIDATRLKLANAHLRPVMLTGKVDFTADGWEPVLTRQLDTCKAMSVSRLFLSVKSQQADPAVICARLHQAGELAASRQVIIALETHPDLMSNGEVALATLKRINHPNVRMNFDTGNIFYYNHNPDIVVELKKVLPYVASIHLKDSDGKFESWNFPALGEGAVDFHGVIGTLRRAGFEGPFVMELEGTKGETPTEASVKQCVAKSAHYILTLPEFSARN